MSTESDSALLRTFPILKMFSNPIYLAVVSVLYLFVAGVTLLYLQQSRENYRLEAQLAREGEHLHRFESRIDDLAAANTDVNVFKRLPFDETENSISNEKLRAALILNSLARDALMHRDFQKAEDSLADSMHTTPTQEAQYYTGILAYVTGDNERAIRLWRQLLSKSGTPNDILLYLSIAEYRSGDTTSARRYAYLYAINREAIIGVVPKISGDITITPPQKKPSKPQP